MITLESVLDDIMLLDFDTREILFEKLKIIQLEARRDIFLQNANLALEEYRSGKVKPQTAEEVIKELNSL